MSEGIALTVPARACARSIHSIPLLSLATPATHMAAAVPLEPFGPRHEVKPKPLSIMANRPEVSVMRLWQVPETVSPPIAGT